MPGRPFVCIQLFLFVGGNCLFPIELGSLSPYSFVLQVFISILVMMIAQVHSKLT